MENLLFPFVLFRHWPPGQWYPKLQKRAVSFSSGSQEGEYSSARDPFSTLPSPSPFASGQQGPVRGRDAFCRAPCPAMEPGECRTTHSDPTSRRTAFRVGPLCSTSLPHCGYVGNSPGPTSTVPGAELLRTIRLGYTIQFAWRPPKFRGIRFTLVLNKDAPVLRAEVAVLLAKDAIEPVPPAEMKSGFYSPYFIVPKKGGGLRPILDLRVLKRALHKLPFRMLTQRRIFQCVRPFDWFAAIDLKDAYIHVSILPRHRPFSALRSKDEHTSTRPSPSGYPCPVSTTVVRTQGYGARDGHGATARTGSQSPRPAATPSAHGRTLLSSGRSSPRASIQACCCFNRCLYHGLRGPCAMGMQLRGSGQGPSCSGISIASSCWQYGLLCATSKRCYTRSMYWSVRTTLRPLRTSTTKAVYAPVACRNSPAISSFGVRII